MIIYIPLKEKKYFYFSAKIFSHYLKICMNLKFSSVSKNKDIFGYILKKFQTRYWIFYLKIDIKRKIIENVNQESNDANRKFAKHHRPL